MKEYFEMLLFVFVILLFGFIHTAIIFFGGYMINTYIFNSLYDIDTVTYTFLFFYMIFILPLSFIPVVKILDKL